MKRQIFGRKAGTDTEFALLISSDGVTSNGSKTDPEKLLEFEISNTRRAVKTLREKSIEGYVIFEGDTTHYLFTPKTDFVYPASNAKE